MTTKELKEFQKMVNRYATHVGRDTRRNPEQQEFLLGSLNYLGDNIFVDINRSKK